MKLIIAIVNYNDSNKVLNELSKHEIGVTKLSTTGGFLRNGNRTFLIGVEDEKVDEVIEIIKSKSLSVICFPSKSRHEYLFKIVSIVFIILLIGREILS